MTTLAERCRRIQHLVLDVDGVLTAGGIVLAAPEDEAGGSVSEIKEFHVRDGLGIKMWRDAGKQLALLSGRTSPVIGRRAADLGVTEVLQGISDKATALRTLSERRQWPLSAIAYVGDDVIDVPALLISGLAVAVADACTEAVRVAHLVTLRSGGRAAVREVIERILRCQGLWPSL